MTVKYDLNNLPSPQYFIKELEREENERKSAVKAMCKASQKLTEAESILRAIKESAYRDEQSMRWIIPDLKLAQSTESRRVVEFLK